MTALFGPFAAAWLAAAGLSHAAEGHEAQAWMEAGVRYRPKKKVRLQLSQNLRFNENVSRTESVMTDMAVSWSAGKNLSVAAGYRLNMDANREGEFMPVHRLHVQSVVDREVGPLSLSHRVRFEESFKVDGTEMDSWHTLRNRVEVELDLDTDLRPVLSVELHSLLAEYRPVLQEKLRFCGGFTYKASKTHVYRLLYINQLPIQYLSDPDEHIISLGYQHRVPRKKKKK